MFKTFAAAVLVFSSFAHADARFNYQAAASSFATAVAPTEAQLTAQPWMAIGIASHSSQDASSDGYWPDGNLTDAGQTGFFHTTVSLTATTDAFGGSGMTWHADHTGAESGKVYSTSEFSGALMNTGLVLQIPNVAGQCGADRECRMAASGRILLCATKVTDKADACNLIYTDAPNYFTAYVPKTP